MFLSMHWPVTIHDLAPGDRKNVTLDPSQFDLALIRQSSDPLFAQAYDQLWREFGPKDGLEEPGVLTRRFLRGPRFLYEMALVRSGGDFIAARDHTAVLTRDRTQLVVHLSHNLVSPTARRTGLAAWMRALPIATARQCLAQNRAPRDTPITLLAEMEHLSDDDPARLIRLRAYERAGFRKIDPHAVNYFQPDFRPPATIDATGGPRPLPFQLIVRRVSREDEDVISAVEVRLLVEALYDLYRPEFRPSDMAHPSLSLDSYPPNDTRVPLVLPTLC
jgi:hypothetical protein